MRINKKGLNQLGAGIIVMALLLFLSGLFSLDNSSQSNYINSNNNYYSNNTSYDPNVLFSLQNQVIGKDYKQIISFSNVYLGSKEDYKVIYLGNSFYLHSNPFTVSEHTIQVSVDNISNVGSLYLYFNTNRTGEENLNVYVNGQLISSNKALPGDIPIVINKNQIKVFKNKTLENQIFITFKLSKPKFYDIFNWNTLKIYDLKVVEKELNNDNKKKSFRFKTDNPYLKSLYVDLVISCGKYSGIEDAPPIYGLLNGQIVFQDNPNCKSSNTVLEKNIPLNLLNNGYNELTLSTNGYYKLAVRVNEIYFNDQDTYYFNVDNFNNINDIVIYGDFDQDVIDLYINDRLISLGRREVKSILPYLVYGLNKITILTKPVEIKNLYIRKE